MMNQEEWTKILEEKEAELGFNAGFKFVYGPWATLDNAEIAFLSLNPGRAPDAAEMRTISDERGNSYEVEQFTTKSPITNQFLQLANFLNKQPSEILAGVIAPFRSDGWDELSEQQKTGSLALGYKFWNEPLRQSSLKLIIACSEEAKELAVRMTSASFKLERPSGWGKIQIRGYRSEDGKIILHLPHLSRFKLMGREQSEQAIRSALEELGWQF